MVKLLVAPTPFERSAVIAASQGDSSWIVPGVWNTSALLAGASAYLALEETWEESIEAELTSVLATYVKSTDPAIIALAATRACALSTWWGVSDGSALEWAEMAVKAQPQWIFNRALLFDCTYAAGQFDRALSIAETLQSVDDLPQYDDEFDRSFEQIFIGRSSWQEATAHELIQQARTALAK